MAGTYPSAFAAALPKDALEKLKAIHEDNSMDQLVKHDKAVEILVALGPEVHAKLESLPPPPYADMLPADLKKRIEALKGDKTLSFAEKCGKFSEIIKEIPDDVKAKIKAARQM